MSTSKLLLEGLKKLREQFSLKGGSCAICGFLLDEIFPKDYPDDWKFCCSCLAWAKFITELNSRVSSEEMNNILINSPTVSKIYYKITLFKGRE